MTSRVSRPVAVLILALAAPFAHAEGIPSASWRTVVTAEGARPGQTLQEAEIWMSGADSLVEERGRGGAKTFVLQLDGEVYVWEEGKSSGSKMAAGLAARSGRPPHDYVRNVEEIRARGKKVGSENLDGQPCEIFEYESPKGDRGTYWLATKLRHFPVKVVLERPMALPYRAEAERRIRLEYRNSNVRVPARRVEAKLALPSGVQFQDLTELMMTGRPPKP
jgi:hypothetical protein